MLARREEYVELGADYYDQRNKPRVVSRLVTRLTKLGYYVSLEPAKQGVLASDAHRAEQSERVPVCVEPPVAAETVPMPPVICESSPGQSAAKVTKPSRTSQPPDSTGSLSAAKDAIVARKRGRPCKCAERGIVCKHTLVDCPGDIVTNWANAPGGIRVGPAERLS